MKKIVAMILSLALAFPAASLLAQQAPASAKQPVQVAQGGAPGFSLFGLSTVATVAVIAVAVIAVAVAVDDNDDPVVATTASATK